MTILEIIKAIADNGFLIVAAAALIWTYLRHEKERSKRADEVSEERKKESENNNKTLIQMLEMIEKHMTTQSEQLSEIKCTPHIHTIEEDRHQEQINQEINDILKHLRESTNSCRATLIRYHNGTVDLAGNSSAKMSITNEDVAPGIIPFSPHFQNQFRGLMAYWCSVIREQGYYYVPDIELFRDLGEQSFYEFLKARGVIGYFGHAVRNKENGVIGFVAIEYMNLESVAPNISKCLEDKAMKISTLLRLNTGGME